MVVWLQGVMSGCVVAGVMSGCVVAGGDEWLCGCRG